MNQTAYQAALDGAAFYQNPTAGCLRISGRDTVAFVQRQTTNDVRLLKSDTGLLTVLTSPAARILDVFYLVAEPGDAKVDTSPTWLAFCMGSRTVDTARFLQKRIFFMDQVEVANHSENTKQIELFGPQAGEILVGLGLNNPPEPNQVARLAFQSLSLLIMNPHPAVGLGYRLAIPPDGLDALHLALTAQGALETNRETYECLRIEAGIPASLAEITEDFTPLEIGLGEAVSPSKGCYTGQEVIARQLTYDKVTQRLCRLSLSAALEANAPLTAADRPAGHITSAAHSPRIGEIALAVVKRPYNEPGACLSSADVEARILA